MIISLDSINFGPYQVTATGIQSVNWTAAITLSVKELSSLASQFASLALHLKKIAEDHQLDIDHNKAACAICSLFASPEEGNWKGSVVNHFVCCCFILSFCHSVINLSFCHFVIQLFSHSIIQSFNHSVNHICLSICHSVIQSFCQLSILYRLFSYVSCRKKLTNAVRSWTVMVRPDSPMVKK